MTIEDYKKASMELNQFTQEAASFRREAYLLPATIDATISLYKIIHSAICLKDEMLQINPNLSFAYQWGNLLLEGISTLKKNPFFHEYPTVHNPDQQ